jgi:pimeloyl-ACP methyl ester carboxylesterase
VSAQEAREPRTQPAPWTFAAPWGARGWVSDLDGPVHWVEFGEPTHSTAAPIVFVHGLGGSHLNWALIAQRIAEGRRAYALDLRGFGMSPGSPHDTSVRANAQLLGRFLDEIVGGPAVLVGNSMGGMISILHTHARPGTVLGVVLVDPALPTPRQRPDLRVASQFVLYAIPGIGEQYMRAVQTRTSARQLVERVVQLCFADPSRASQPLLDAATALAQERRSIPNGEQSFLRASRSLMGVLARPAAYREMMHGIDVPVLLVHGEADRLVFLAAARDTAAANPSWQTQFLPGVGHTPQLETPALVIESVSTWLASHPALSRPEE